jgi:hypothetical protein
LFRTLFRSCAESWWGRVSGYNHVVATNPITEALSVSSEFANKLDDLVTAQGGFRLKDDSEWMLATQWHLNATLHNSILTLFQANLPAGAFALLRPVIENLFRVHLLVMGEPDGIQKLRSDKFRLNFFHDTRKIDDHFGLGGDFKSLVAGMVDFLHSLTHLGMQQMRRQFRSDFYGLNLEANYPEREIVGVIGMSTLAKFMITSRVVERFHTIAEQAAVKALLVDFMSTVGRQPQAP